MNAQRTLVLCFLIGFLAFANTACASSSHASVGFGIRVSGPPPAAFHEARLHRPGHGYVWVPGYWDWRGPRLGYVRVSGAWVRPPRPRAVWVAPRWRTHRHETFYIAGHWRH